MNVRSTHARTPDAPSARMAPAADARQPLRQMLAEHEVERFRQALGPFVVAAEATRMAMIFTNAGLPDNPIIFANDAFLALTGYDSDEVVRQSFRFLMSRVAEPEAIEAIAVQFEEKATETIDVMCKRKDGSRFLAAIRINPVEDKQGNVRQHCISFINRSADEERVIRERDALHALFQHTPDFIAMMEGPEHRFTFANDAYQLLVGNWDVVGETLAEALPGIVGQGFVELLDEVYRTGVRFTGENMPVELAGENGPEPHFVDFIYQAIRDDDGTIIGIFCEGHDVTGKKQARDQMQALQAQVTQTARASAMVTMAATLAHELSQPLTVISNYVSVCNSLFAAGTDMAALAQALGGISEGSRRAAQIMRSLKDMSEQREANRERFDLKEAIRESIGLIHAGAHPGAPIDDTGCARVTIEADRVQIEQVIMNLARNACEAIAGTPDCQVVISTSVKENCVVVSVRDSGPGVTSGAAADLFEWSDSSKPGGMGIGLSICRTIIEAHGGRIWLESGSGGADFRFSVPIAD